MKFRCKQNGVSERRQRLCSQRYLNNGRQIGTAAGSGKIDPSQPLQSPERARPHQSDSQSLQSRHLKTEC